MKRLGWILFLTFFPAAVLAATFTVDVVGMAFNPPALTVDPGDTVTWRFLEPNHTTTSNATTGSETWNSGIVAPGGTFSHTFSAPGSHPYYCAIHSSPAGTAMNGVIAVNSPPPPPVPTLTSVNPASGVPAGGTAVTLSGTAFAAPCTSTFDGTAAATTFVSSTTLQATTPAHAAGTVSVVVTCANGSSTLPGAFTYVAAAPALPIPTASTMVLLLIALSLAFVGWARGS